ncbi:hypothetical protein GCM10023169_30910 [Georgenia halophila]|uniref:Phosphodiesterase n=1 Tax=Georgenia halophila TaxID=620889 RepID=A0ABP8LIJ0_9MICO
MGQPLDRTLAIPAAVAGVTLGALAVGMGLARGAKGFHPRGRVVDAVLDVPAEVPALSTLGRPGRHDAVARFSDGAGLPRTWLDVRGLAVRLPGPVDLLLSSGGPGRVTRFVPLPRVRRWVVMTSLVPFRSDVGPVVLAARPTGDRRTWELAWARGAGPWRPFGVLRCAADPETAADRPLRFDPVLNGPVGLPPYRWAAQLRRFGYAWSRRHVRAVAAPPG